MQEFIAKIGKGQKVWKDLTWEEAKEAMRLLIEGRATPVQIGGFLLAMRIKMESVAELAAFTAAAREYVPALKISRHPEASALVLNLFKPSSSIWRTLSRVMSCERPIDSSVSFCPGKP